MACRRARSVLCGASIETGPLLDGSHAGIENVWGHAQVLYQRSGYPVPEH